jgi:hypothetical protein
MDAAGQLAQLGDGLTSLLGGPLQQRRQVRVGPGHLAAGHAQGKDQGHQPLLGTVVQVTLDAPPRGVAGLHDPRPGGAHLLQLGLDFSLEPGMLQSHAGRRRGQPRPRRLSLLVK